MSDASPSLSAHIPAEANAAAMLAGLSKVVYRSRATKDFSPLDLHQLTLAAQARNERESVTGLMLYSDHHFFQWIEGPSDGVSRVMSSIRNDTRHSDVEVLDDKPVQSRHFAEWTMKLAAQGPKAPFWQSDVIEPPMDVIETLRRKPDAAPTLLVKLVSATTGPAASEAQSSQPLKTRTASILKDVFLASVLPQLVGRHPAVRAGAGAWIAHPRAAELAELLISADAGAAQEMIAELRGDSVVFLPMLATVFEPAARRLGDMWTEDTCTDVDVTLGLSRLQTALRLLSAGSPRQLPQQMQAPIALIVPEPGEMHRLGVAMDMDVMSQAGWAPRCEFPKTDQALADLVSGTWFDALDLSLSTAQRHEHLLPRMTATIAAARKASRNPGLVVVVGGRVFIEEALAGADIGADGAATTSLGVNQLVTQLVHEVRANPAVRLH